MRAERIRVGISSTKPVGDRHSTTGLAGGEADDHRRRHGQPKGRGDGAVAEIDRMGQVVGGNGAQRRDTLPREDDYGDQHAGEAPSTEMAWSSSSAISVP